MNKLRRRKEKAYVMGMAKQAPRPSIPVEVLKWTMAPLWISLLVLSGIIIMFTTALTVAQAGIRAGLFVVKAVRMSMMPQSLSERRVEVSVVAAGRAVGPSPKPKSQHLGGNNRGGN